MRELTVDERTRTREDLRVWMRDLQRGTPAMMLDAIDQVCATLKNLEAKDAHDVIAKRASQLHDAIQDAADQIYGEVETILTKLEKRS